MSLFGALNTAISGLTAQSAAFTNIGDNVANSQTAGFKRVDTAFEDYLTTSSATRNESGAVVATPEYRNGVQGAVSQTDQPLNLAIAGQGFFAVSAQTGVSPNGPIFSKTTSYTRTGDFSLNKDGYLQNSSGNILNGYVQDPAQVTGVLDTSQIKPIHINQAGFSPIATTQVTLAANLPATPTGTLPIQSQVQVYDALGQQQVLQLAWTPVAGTPSKWQVAISQAGVATPIGTASVAFGPTANAASPAGTIGALATVSGAVTGSAHAANGAATLSLTTDFGSGSQVIALNLGTFDQANGLTQFAGTDYVPRALSQNGVPPGNFSSVTTKSDGQIQINYDTGQSQVVGRVPLATFANPDALQRQNGQAFTASSLSGPAQTVAVGTSGGGQLVVSAVEGSNVDIANEFAKLIVAQRAYSANTKLVTTADQLLQETLDLKR